MRRAKPERRLIRPACVVTCLLGALGAQAQDDGRAASPLGLGLKVEATASATETITDNLRLSTSDRRAEAITMLTAGLRIAGRLGGIQGSLDYSLSGFVYARGSESARHQQRLSLSSAGSVELVDNWAYLDVSAGISQQAISAFGLQSSADGLVNPNRTEVRQYLLSPYVRGRLGSFATYQARISHSVSSSSGTSLGDASTDTASISLASGSPGAVVGWTAGASRTVTDSRAGRPTDTSQVTAGTVVRPHPEIQFTGSVGREFSDVVTADSRSTAYWSLGVDMRPSERTRLSAQRSHRYFGNAYQLNFSHRLQRSMWSLTSSRDVSQPGGALSAANTTAFDLLFAQLAAIEPDPIRRAELATAALRDRGIDPGAQVSVGFLSATATVATRHQLSASLQGVRDTVTATLFSSDSRRADGQFVTAGDDLSSADRVRQRGYSVTVGHRLTPVSSLSLSASVNRASGSAASQSNRLSSVLLVYSARLGVKSNGSLSLRRAQFSSPANPYSENAAIATFSLRF